MEPADTEDVTERYARFAERETSTHSAVLQAWAAGVAQDAEVAELIETLPSRERQPNLIFAATRLADPDLVDPHQRVARDREYELFRASLLGHWEQIRTITAERHTQTNEAGRLAVVLPVLHQVATETGRELALIELGASAGLALHPHWWRFRYVRRDQVPIAEFGPAGREAITVVVKNHFDHPDPAEVPPVVVPPELPPIMWRLGVDQHPLNPAHPEDAEWLRTLVWPGQSHRLTRLDAAIDAACHDPVLVLRHDITDPEAIDEVLRLVPRDYLPVVFHGAVLAYLSTAARAAFAADMLRRVKAGELRWVCNEGQYVIPQVVEALDSRPDFRRRLRRGAFVVSLDGRPLYQADGHAGWVL
ncbi:DUF2332 family protein [Aestuariimicrobium sp. Y1814]|uniref:DUF2332 family protein n=1 Tax=Aestuariimicrobium sp. Y1814 TaxID=3418742 RepID=UPI003DA72EFD